MILIGSSVVEGNLNKDLYTLLIKLASQCGFINYDRKWNGFNILHKEVGNIGAFELGYKFNSTKNGNFKPKVVYLLNCDDFDSKDIPEDAFVIYQGTHGDKGAERANLILPGASYLEKTATYVSTEGRVSSTRVVINFV